MDVEKNHMVPGTVANAVRGALCEALASTRTVGQAAQRLGVGRSTVYRWLGQMNIDEAALQAKVQAPVAPPPPKPAPKPRAAKPLPAPKPPGPRGTLRLVNGALVMVLPDAVAASA